MLKVMTALHQRLENSLSCTESSSQELICLKLVLSLYSKFIILKQNK